MPTVAREQVFRLVFYVDDHLRLHVHLGHSGATARIMNGDPDHRPLSPNGRKGGRPKKANRREHSSSADSGRAPRPNCRNARAACTSNDGGPPAA